MWDVTEASDTITFHYDRLWRTGNNCACGYVATICVSLLPSIWHCSFRIAKMVTAQVGILIGLCSRNEIKKKKIELVGTDPYPWKL